MGQASVERAEMQKAAGEIQTTAENIHKIQNDLNGQINALIGSGWVGNAATKFYQKYNEFDQQFVVVKKELDGIYEKMTQSQLNYTNIEDENDQQANSLDSALNG